MSVLLEARAISKVFGDLPVLRNLTVAVEEREIVSLLGPSGCGKSTLLRVIAGLELDYTGSVLFEGRAVDAIPVHQRGFGLMFQDFALFPHRSVAQNVGFGPRMQGLQRREVARQVDAALDLVGLAGYGSRTIFELSGGERQRVALARALAPRPRLLLLDEPLGALDRTLRERLTEDLRSIIKGTGTTSIYVTHDQVEAFAVADHVVLMNAGTIVQVGTPAEVYRRPASAFAARFLGLNNLVEGVSDGPGPASLDGSWLSVRTPLGSLYVSGDRLITAGEPVLVLIRPEAARPAAPDAVNVVRGAIVRRTFRGGLERVVLRHASGIELDLDVEAGLLPADDTAEVALRPPGLTLVPLPDP